MVEGLGPSAGALEDLDDETLMVEIAGGNRPAFDVLCRRHLKRGLRTAYRVIPRWHDAEEVVQDAFIQVWDRADTWRPDSAKFTTWFHRVVVNRAIDYRRRREFVGIDEAPEMACPRPDAEAAVEERRLSDHVDRIIADLPERQRTALGLCYYEELSCAEAAKVMGVSVSAMESLLVRARRVVRTHLNGLFGEGGEGKS